MSARLERNWKMAHQASENVTKPSSKKYRDNWADIFGKKVAEKRKNKKA